MPLAPNGFVAIPLLDGRVLVIAESGQISDLGGGPSPPSPTRILDPATGRWTDGAALNASRSVFAAVRLNDGRVLVAGGDNGWRGSYSSAKLFDPQSGTWSSTGLLNTARAYPAGALLPDGRVLVAGGHYSEGYEDVADFDSGRDVAGRDLGSAEIYDPATGRWTVTGSLHVAGSFSDESVYALPDGRVLVGGAPAEVYDPVAGTWAIAGDVVRRPGSASVVLEDGSLLVIGGTEEVLTSGPDGERWTYPPVATVLRVDPEAGATTEVAPLPAPRTDAVAVRLADGRVLVAGGTEDAPPASGGDAPPTATAFIYDPTGDAWSAAAPMPFADRPGAAVLLADGSVIVTGGTIPLRLPDLDTPPEAVGWTARFWPEVVGGG